MSSPISMYVISNGDLAREALNAVSALLGSSSFTSAMKIGILFSIYGAALNYMHRHDVIVFAKWFITYFGITVIMLTPKVTLQIIDVSNMGASYTVSVPFGLGYPASMITTTAHGIIEAFEKNFHTPNDLSYNRTGMLFGSKLFKISSEFNAVDPGVRNELNEYVKNCVLGDILISKKYTMTDLSDSTNLLDTITENPSNIRGIYINGKFKTCLAAVSDLKKHLKTDISGNLLSNLGKRFSNLGKRSGIKNVTNDESKNTGSFIGRVFGSQETQDIKGTQESQETQRILEAAYRFFNYGGLSSTATEIATQNVLINGIRDGLLNYTAETGATAALLNLSTSQAMDKMRLTLATSRNVALYTIPIIHTVLLLLMLSLFPLIILLALQPSLTGMVLKNYLYTLFWIESWPIMFACLNMMITFYTKELGPGGLTISNIDKLILEHSDISNMAGYLMLSIPFISGGLVKGMSSAFNHAASYIGGVLQSSASSAASEAVSGNIHLGNSSWNNVNANKFDTNSTLMHGMATEQLKTGVLRHTMPDGTQTYDSAHSLSRLPANVRVSELLSSSKSEQAEAAKTATIQDQVTYDQSMSHAVNELDSLGKSLDSKQSISDNFTSRKTTSAAQSASRMKSTAKNIAKLNNLEFDDVYRGLVSFSQNASLKGDVSFSGKIPLAVPVEGKIGLSGEIGVGHTTTSETSAKHSTGRTMNVSAEDMKRFSEDLHMVEEYSKSHSVDQSKTTADSHLSQLSTDLRNARTASKQYSAHKAEYDRSSHAASYFKQNSAQIDSDWNQVVVDKIVETKGRTRAEELFAGKNAPELMSAAKDAINQTGIENDILSKYQQSSAGIDPNKKYQDGALEVQAKSNNIKDMHAREKQKLVTGAKKAGVGVSEKELTQERDAIENKKNKLEDKLKKSKENSDAEYNKMEAEVSKDIADGSKYAEKSILDFGEIKPDFTDPNKSKK